MQTNADSATIVISRKHGGWRDRGRSYVALVDAEPVGKIKHGQSLEFAVPSGPHELAMKVSWCSSRSLAFDAQAGDVIRFFCEPGGPASAGLQDVLGAPDTYIRLTFADRPA